MNGRHATKRRTATAVALALLALALFAGAGATAFTGPGGPPDTRDERLLPPRAPVVPWGDLRLLRPRTPSPPRPAPRQLPNPAQIEIPAIGVAARIVPLGLNPDGTLKVPKRPADTGWFVDGPEPGEQGSAVIAGHVDSRTGPAVFYRLRALRAGDRIRVVLRTGRQVSFVVRGGRQYSKQQFPVKLVYGTTKQPTLRLITCDGRFDRSTRHYVDNYVVFASRIA
jgi:sortase (surface protein transpeptidase)